MEDQDRQQLASLEAKLRALTARINALAEGNLGITAEGLRVGSTRIFEKLVSAAYHLYQREADGTESDLAGATSLRGIPLSETAPTASQVLVYDAALDEWVPSDSSTPGAHALGGAAHTADTLAHLNAKVSDATLDDHGDSRPPTAHTHDGRYYTEAEHGGVSPQGHHAAATLDEDGEILFKLTGQELGLKIQSANQVMAGPGAGLPNQPTFRALVAADLSLAVLKTLFDATTFLYATDDNTPLAKTPAEVKAILDLEIGTDVLAQQTIGIADDNLLEVDDADAADNDYAKFTANGIEGREASEVRTDINVADGADVTGDNPPQAHTHDADALTPATVGIDSTPANDTCSGITAELTAGAALSYGDMVYYGADGKMEKTDANAEATSRCVACCAESGGIAENATGTFLKLGYIEHEFNFGTVGARVYLDTATPGGVTLTAPSGTDDCIVVVGISVAADCLDFNPTVHAIVEHT